MGARRLQRYDKLFVIDVKDRVINNTPYDVYRVLSQFPNDRIEIIDLRFVSRDIRFPESGEAYLFLETAGTWMCFDWAPDRFADCIARLQAICTRLTVIGPQARALREYLDGDFRIIDGLDFQSQIVPGGQGKSRTIDDVWSCRRRNREYNGEFWDGARLRLRETFSVYRSMNCPMACSFCFYGSDRHEPSLDFRMLFEDMGKLRRAGYDHFYFMDPNFKFDAGEYRQWLEFQDRMDRKCSFCCQLSPNLLSRANVNRLKASGCCSVVVGAENRELIRFKGSVAKLTDSLKLVTDCGMIPVLFFLIDGRNDVRRLVDHFDGYPFRYGLLNRAYASDRSLGAILTGFSERERLREKSSDAINELRALPTFLENAVAHREGL